MAMQSIPKKNHDDSLTALLEDLVAVIERRTVGHEYCPTEIGSLRFFRREAPSEPCVCLLEPCVVFVVQGAKQLLVGEHVYAYDTRSFLLNALDLPAASQVLDAAPDRPCVGIMFRLDVQIMTDIIATSGLTPPREYGGEGGTALGAMTKALLEPCRRLVALLDEPHAIPVLAPLIEREIHFRLLTSELAGRVWQIASVGSQSHRIARAVDWLRANYTQPLRIDELAAHVQMSASTLHHHFRLLTTMSPLQYQKWLRLNEARRLMLNERLDATSAAFNVGYESASQFSREYGRLFGMPPKRDIAGLLQRTA
jgi:AraC-like DNA-binding protein